MLVSYHRDNLLPITWKFSIPENQTQPSLILMTKHVARLHVQVPTVWRELQKGSETHKL